MSWLGRTVEERFWSKVDMSGDCWIWTAGVNRGGYGTFKAGGRTMVKAHRWAYENIVGPIPQGAQLDHLCRNRACVNPDHLEPVSCRVNVLRGEGIAAINAAKEFCANGHLFDERNTQPRPRGGRNCRKCHQEKQRARRHESRQE